MNTYIVPPGVIGLQGTASTWDRLDRGNPMPATWSLVDDAMEIRLFRYGHDDLDELRAAALGLVLLRPGAVVPLEDGITVPVPVDTGLTVDPRRRRGRSARRRPR